MGQPAKEQVNCDRLCKNGLDTNLYYIILWVTRKYKQIVLQKFPLNLSRAKLNLHNRLRSLGDKKKA